MNLFPAKNSIKTTTKTETTRKNRFHSMFHLSENFFATVVPALPATSEEVGEKRKAEQAKPYFILLIDETGSMNTRYEGNSRLHWAVTAVKTLTAEHKDFDAFFYAENGENRVVKDNNVSSHIHAEGGTNITDSLNQCMDMLEKSPNFTYHLILLTDGDDFHFKTSLKDMDENFFELKGKMEKKFETFTMLGFGDADPVLLDHTSKLHSTSLTLNVMPTALEEVMKKVGDHVACLKAPYTIMVEKADGSLEEIETYQVQNREHILILENLKGGEEVLPADKKEDILQAFVAHISTHVRKVSATERNDYLDRCARVVYHVGGETEKFLKQLAFLCIGYSGTNERRQASARVASQSLSMTQEIDSDFMDVEALMHRVRSYQPTQRFSQLMNELNLEEELEEGEIRTSTRRSYLN